MLDRDTLEFVRTGLERYPDARETVSFFEETIYKSIVDALQHREWRTFHPLTNNKGGRVIAKNKGITFIHAWIDGSTKYPGVRSVYLGIYWEDPVVAAVGLFDEKYKKFPIKSASALNGKVRFNPSDQSLGLEIGTEFDPDTDFKRLLDALEDAIESDASTTAATQG
jgi:hypothetical protein